MAMQLHGGGDYLQDIFEALVITDAEEKVHVEMIKKFDAYFVPASNVTYERIMFFNKRQSVKESFEQYMAALPNMSKTCEFETIPDSLVRDVFVCRIKDKYLRKGLLCASSLTMDKALEICRARAVVAVQVNEMEQNIKTESFTTEPVALDVVRRQSYRNKKSTERSYKFFGRSHVYGRCPAWGKNGGNVIN